MFIKQVGENGDRLECEFRHLSLAEYMTALHVHITGDSLKGTKTQRNHKDIYIDIIDKDDSTFYLTPNIL